MGINVDDISITLKGLWTGLSLVYVIVYLISYISDMMVKIQGPRLPRKIHAKIRVSWHGFSNMAVQPDSRREVWKYLLNKIDFSMEMSE